MLALDTLHVVGVSHHESALEVREALALAVADRPATLRRLAAVPGVRGVLLLSTCNRVELYLDADARALPDVGAVIAGEHAGSLVQVHGRDAVAHAFRVAAGLDSMALGDAQILGQWKAACKEACEAGTLSPSLAKLRDRTAAAAREARTRTEVGRHAVSLSHVAVELVHRIFGDLKTRKVLLVGTGKMARLAARKLLDCGASATIVAGRRYEHAASMAAELKLQAVPASALAEELGRHDVVVSATSCPVAVLTRDMVAAAVAHRRGQPLILVDLAVPRDIDPAVRELAGVFLYDVDGLREVADANRRQRQHDAVAAEQIVVAAVAAFEAEHGDASATIVRLRRHAEEIRQAELAKASKRLGHLTPEQSAVIEAATRAIVNRVLHVPTTQLRLLAGSGHEAELQLAQAVLGIAPGVPS